MYLEPYQDTVTLNREANQWEEVDTQALTTILMNIVPNVQAGLDCSSAKLHGMDYQAVMHKQILLHKI